MGGAGQRQAGPVPAPEEPEPPDNSPEAAPQPKEETKEETKANRNKFTGVVIGLLVIATAVPMIQYYGYVGGK